MGHPKATTRKQGLSLNDPDFPHGTTGGFARGCKDPENCPATPSCRDANRAYQRDWHARKKGNTTETSAEATTASGIGDDPQTASAEPEPDLEAIATQDAIELYPEAAETPAEYLDNDRLAAVTIERDDALALVATLQEQIAFQDTAFLKLKVQSEQLVESTKQADAAMLHDYQKLYRAHEELKTQLQVADSLNHLEDALPAAHELLAGEMYVRLTSKAQRSQMTIQDPNREGGLVDVKVTIGEARDDSERGIRIELESR